ncbi:hypothetical protein BDA96_03G020300 [Sorghum bicolor]|uniref:Embryo surrounding factor 1 brassicaceae domain-containing protein n=2 Tax=Sorghum bicolor TaxID=4558 RepID=A0A921UKZ2_SORBI|nr:hypothetical protein BDA96_03G020300 [Sorghum bicolor]KXG31575.1 hypothetical protein SORBI_3003G020700 [Sorghum bicolor]
MKRNSMTTTMFLCAMLFGSLTMQTQCRPHQLLDGRRRSVVVDTIANSTWSLEDERKSDKLMVCLKYQCNDFEPNGTCFCCEISKDNDCYSTHDECVDNCHRCKGPNC